MRVTPSEPGHSVYGDVPGSAGGDDDPHVVQTRSTELCLAETGGTFLKEVFHPKLGPFQTAEVTCGS